MEIKKSEYQRKYLLFLFVEGKRATSSISLHFHDVIGSHHLKPPAFQDIPKLNLCQKIPMWGEKLTRNSSGGSGYYILTCLARLLLRKCI